MATPLTEAAADLAVYFPTDCGQPIIADLTAIRTVVIYFKALNPTKVYLKQTKSKRKSSKLFILKCNLNRVI